MIALLALLAAAVALSVLLASSRAQVRDLKSALLARDAELRSEREVRSAESAARAALEARLDSSEEKHQRLQETFAALSRQALDANSRHLLELGEQILARAQDMSRAESDKRAQVLTELVRPVQDSLDILLGMSKVDVEVRVDPTLLRPSDVLILWADSSKFMDATGWKPTIPYEQTLRDLLDYWRERV